VPEKATTPRRKTRAPSAPPTMPEPAKAPKK
jgi:hypothetical protein